MLKYMMRVFFSKCGQMASMNMKVQVNRDGIGFVLFLVSNRGIPLGEG